MSHLDWSQEPIEEDENWKPQYEDAPETEIDTEADEADEEVIYDDVNRPTEAVHGTHIYEIDDPNFRALNDDQKSNIIGLRVGYILYSTFNGKLISVIDEESRKILITITNDLSIESDVRRKLDLPELINFISHSPMGEYFKYKIELSSLILSTLNEIFIATQLLPFQPLNRVVAVIHPWVLATAAINALYMCMILFPYRMEINVRMDIASLLLPNIDQEIIRSIATARKGETLLTGIQKVNEIVLGNIIKKICNKFNSLTASEISYILDSVKLVSFQKYQEFIESETPKEVTSGNVSVEIAEISKCIDDVEAIKNSLVYSKSTIIRIKNECSDIRANLLNIKRDNNLLSETAPIIMNKFNEILPYVTDKGRAAINLVLDIYQEKMHHSRRGTSTDVRGQYFIPGYFAGSSENYRTDALIHLIDKGTNEVIRQASYWLERFNINENNSINSTIANFFQKRGLVKRVSTVGGIQGAKGLTALMAYIFNLLLVKGESDDLADADRIQLESLRSRVVTLSDEADILPVQAIVRELRYDFEELNLDLPDECKTEFNSLCSQLQMCSNFNQAWSIALRLKGLLYEAFFARSWNIKYVPEDLKHNLITIIRHTMPIHVTSFLARTNSHPEVRELKPDFVLVKVPCLTKGIEDTLIKEQRHDDKMSATKSTICSSYKDTASQATGKSTMSGETMIYISRGKAGLWHELGSDELIGHSEKEPLILVNKLINYGKEHSCQGGIITEDYDLSINRDDDESSEQQTKVSDKQEVLDTKEKEEEIKKGPTIPIKRFDHKRTGEDISEEDIEKKLKELQETLTGGTASTTAQSIEDQQMAREMKKAAEVFKSSKAKKIASPKKAVPARKPEPIALTTKSRPIRECDTDSKYVRDEFLDELDKDEPKQSMLFRDWKQVTYTETVDKYELVLLEVGYQTDQEGKIITDLSKWKPVVNILKSLGIRVFVISAVDKTSQDYDQWWIKKSFVIKLKRTISVLFAQLSKNSPLDVSEHIVGDISSQKIRMFIRKGSLVRPPILKSHIINYYQRWESELKHRPTGVKIPRSIMADLEQSLAKGASIDMNHPSFSLEGTLDHITDISETIIEEVKKCPIKVEETKRESSSYQFLLGWLEEDLSHRRCEGCYKKLINELKQMDTKEAIEKAANELEVSLTCVECIKSIEIISDRLRFTKSLLNTRTNALDKICSLLHQQNIFTGIDPEEAPGKRTCLDELVASTLPGKTQKQRRIKHLIKQMTQQVVSLNDIAAIKDSKGQIMISKDYKKIQKNMEIFDQTYKNLLKKRYINELEEIVEDEELKIQHTHIKSDSGLNKEHVRLLKSIRRTGEDIIKLMTGEYSDHHINLITKITENPFGLEDSKCCLPTKWVDGILSSLKIEEDTLSFVRKMISTLHERSKMTVKDDTMPNIEYNEIKEYLLGNFKELEWLQEDEMIFNRDCLIFDEVLNETKRRLDGKVYQEVMPYLEGSLKLLFHFKWFQRTCLYSKICQIFIQSCSEYQHSGLRVKKIPHTNLNLVVRVPERKSSNMLCNIRGPSFEDIGTEAFYLNRRQAIMGQAIPYCYITSFVQLLQIHFLIPSVLTNEDFLKEQYNSSVAESFQCMLAMIMYMKKGKINLVRREVESLDHSLNNIQVNTPGDTLARFLQSFNITFGILLGPSIALNNQSFNKQIQNIRYPYMLSLSEFGFPKGLGKKMSSPRRRIELEVSRLYLQCCCALSMWDPLLNINNWKLEQHYPETNLMSVSLFGQRIISDRALSFDIYLVHIFNKELDDFDTGSIRVLEEYGDRHCAWEKELAKNINWHNNTRSKADKRDAKQKIRLLLGIPRLNVSSGGSHTDGDSSTSSKSGKHLESSTNLKETIIKEEDELDNKSNGKDSSDASKVNSSASSTISDSHSTTASNQPEKEERVDSRSSQARNVTWSESSSYYTRSARSFSFRITPDLEMVRSDETEGETIVRPYPNEMYYRPSLKSLTSDILEIIKKFPKYTYGSYELLQLAAENSKKVLNPGALEKSRRSGRNWCSITNVCETTSILAEPKANLNLTQALEILKRQQSKKFMKLLKQRLDHSKDCSSKADKESVIKYFQENMELESKLWGDVGKRATAAVKGICQLDYVNWKKLIKMSLKDSIFSPDANKVYYWVKSLSADVRSLKQKREIMMKHTDPEVKKVREHITLGTCLNIYTLNSLEDSIKECYKIWLQDTILSIDKMKVPVPSAEDMKTFVNDLSDMWESYIRLKTDKQRYSSATFTVEELALYNSEKKFVDVHTTTILQILNLMILHIMTSPWSQVMSANELAVIASLGLGNLSEELSAEEGYTSLLKLLFKYEIGFEELLNVSEKERDMIIKYVSSMFASNDLPFKHIYTTGEVQHSNDHSALLKAVRLVIAQIGLESISVDFMLTIITIKSKNFIASKRLLGKSSQDRLPRSVRSKVIFEIIKKVRETSHIILQQQAFAVALDVEHRNFASLAPKAQLGGDRDLLVQEVSTKLINAVSELFAKSLLDNTVCDILVNPKLKESILDKSNELKQQCNLKHGKSSVAPNETIKKVNFMKCYCIAGDNTKWGPIHCTSLFSALYQQLLSEVKDWKNFEMLVMLKSLIKQIEIPIASVEKIFKTMMYHKGKELGSKPVNNKLISELLLECADLWEHKPFVKNLVSYYISKGKIAMNSYNHMGQGIHHATSSLLNFCVSTLVETLLKKRFKRNIPSLNIEISHAGSSDDFTKIILITGRVNETEFDEIEKTVKKEFKDLMNYMIGIMRACQMYVSEKSVFSSCVNEVYSDFDLYWRISPSVIKFIISTIINSTVSSPLTLYQSMHVCCQQALFMSASFLTNLTFALCRQQVFFNHCERTVRVYGPILFRLPSSFGRLYIPEMGKLLTNSHNLEDLEACLTYISYLECLSIMGPGRCSQPPLPLSIPGGSDVDIQHNVAMYLQHSDSLKDFTPRESPIKEISSRRGSITPPEELTALGLDIPDSEMEAKFGGSGSYEGLSTEDDDSSEVVSHRMGEREPFVIDVVEKPVAEKESVESVKNARSILGMTNAQKKFSLKILEGLPEKVTERPQEKISSESINIRSHTHDNNKELLLELKKIIAAQAYSKTALSKAYQDSEVKEDDLLILIATTKVYAGILFGYEYMKSTGLEKILKTEMLTKDVSSFEDPFSMAMPETLRLMMNKLKLIRTELEEIDDDIDYIKDLRHYVSCEIIQRNCATENYSSEVKRLQQVITSRNVISGLSGGLKELSIPFYRLFMNAYFFHDKCGLKLPNHWTVAKDDNIVSNELKAIKGCDKVKYKDWISKLTELDIALDISETDKPEFKLEMLHRCDGITIDPSENLIIVSKEKLKVFKKHLSEVIAQLSSHNRIKMSKVECSKVTHGNEVRNIVVCKTKLFSKESFFKLDNNPAIVMAYCIDPLSVTSVKPVNINFSTLEQDKASLISFYPFIGQIIDELEEHVTSDLDKLKSVISSLSGICRSIISSNITMTNFHAFRPVTVKYDDSLSTIVGHGLIEGYKFSINEELDYSSTYSERYYRILECISLMNELPISEPKKTSLLYKFLMWNPSNCTDKICFEDNKTAICPDMIKEADIRSMFTKEVIASQLLLESKSLKNARERNRVINLANLSINPSQISHGLNRSDLSLVFKHEGEPFIDGRYQLSCQFGNSVGMFLDNKLIISLNNNSAELLNIVELEALKWCLNIRTTIVSVTNHNWFIGVLPVYENVKFLMKNCEPLDVRLSANVTEGLAIHAPNNESRVVFVKSDLMTERIFKPDFRPRSPLVKWVKGSIIIYVIEDTEFLRRSRYTNIIQSIMKLMKCPMPEDQSLESLQEQKIVVDRIHLPNTASRAACQLFHMFMWHEYTLSEHITNVRVESIKKIKETGGVDYYRNSIINDQSYIVVNTFALGTEGIKKKEVAKLYQHAMQTTKPLASESSKDDIESKTIKGGQKGRDKGGYYTLNDEDEKIYILEGESGYEELKAEVDTTYDSESNDLKLPEILPIDLRMLITEELLNKDKTERLYQLQALLNSNFKDVNTWPFVSKLLELLNFDDMKFEVSTHTDKSLRWKLVYDTAHLNIKTNKSIFDNLRALETGSVPLPFAHMIIVKPYLSQFYKQCSDLILFLNQIKYGPNFFNLAIACLIFCDYFEFKTTNYSYNWISLLSSIYPVIILKKEEHHRIVFKISEQTTKLMVVFKLDNELIRKFNNETEKEFQEYEDKRKLKIRQRQEKGKKVPKGWFEPYDKMHNYNQKVKAFILESNAITKGVDLKKQEVSPIDSVTDTQSPDCVEMSIQISKNYINNNLGPKELFIKLTSTPSQATNVIFGYIYKMFDVLFELKLTDEMRVDIEEMDKFVQIGLTSIKDLKLKKEIEDPVTTLLPSVWIDNAAKAQTLEDFDIDSDEDEEVVEEEEVEDINEDEFEELFKMEEALLMSIDEDEILTPSSRGNDF